MHVDTPLRPTRRQRRHVGEPAALAPPERCDPAADLGAAEVVVVAADVQRGHVVPRWALLVAIALAAERSVQVQLVVSDDGRFRRKETWSKPQP